MENPVAPPQAKTSPPKSRDGWQRVRRQANISRVIDLLQQSGDLPIRLAEFCEKAGVSERTLRSIFKELYGVGPNRYLLIRRLHLVRAALAIANPNTDSVSHVAIRFGFSDSGRMAAEYYTLFGEYPSKTLTRTVS